jgi:glutaredoxin
LESAEVEASVEREAPTEPSRVATEEDAPDASLPPSSTDPELAPSPSAPDSALAAAPPSPAPSASQARPTEQALASAIRGTPITMFSTGWCGVCARARAFLAANDLRYSERDIDHDANAREELKRRTGKASIPTFEIDGELLTPGFSEQAVMAAVAKSAQRRLGVEKLELRRAQ